jgi:hypothetical protein
MRGPGPYSLGKEHTVKNERTRIEEAFAMLRDWEDILARGNCACCPTCGHLELSQELQDYAADPDNEGLDPLTGYVFWDMQDEDKAFDEILGNMTGMLRIRPSDATTAATVLTYLRGFGLRASWDGDPGRCIQVRPDPHLRAAS